MVPELLTARAVRVRLVVRSGAEPLRRLSGDARDDVEVLVDVEQCVAGPSGSRLSHDITSYQPRARHSGTAARSVPSVLSLP
ncbi:hypothetical protein GCM10023322_50210 [Rugosimonospora acidiphila]|uniref:Uncharacterized protein n=1 Tax=Rugosimonospora acidiphila TaxID=556531 RepID=A0ABP9S6Q9_9ACTN